MNRSTNNRTLIHRVFSKEHSLILRGDGLRWIEDMLAHYRVSPEDVEDTLNTLATECESEVTLRDASAVVDQHILQTVYDRLLAPIAEEPTSNPDHEADSLISESHTFKVIDAFQIPRLTWSEDRKIFEVFEAGKSKPSILGQPISRSLYLRDRYHVIKQVILRNEHFSPPAVAGGAGAEEREEYMKLTSTRNMLGRAGQRFLLFGMLSRMQDYSYCLEDLDGRVKLELSNATPAEGFFTEGCFVLAEGEYQSDESFRVLEIGHPPSEQREVCRKQFAHIDFTGTGALSLSEEAKLVKAESASDTQFIVMSDFHLDNPSVLINFERIMEGYEEQFQSSGGGIRPPPVWVLCGDFSQQPFIFDGNMTTAYTALFTKLANSLSKYSSITPHIHLVVVPGPHDPWSSTTLPRPSLPLPIVKPLLSSASRIPKENIHLVSNPCRIRWMSQELVIYRENLMSKMCRNLVSESLKDPTSAMDSEREDMAKFPHLSPLALNIRPVLWEFDQALRLYPMPTALVLADSYPPYRLTYEGCHVFNPGSFGVGSKPIWANYHLATRTSEERSVPL
ncbi:DNA polymerase alpha/epsilon subunit B-domain-containing protein [Melampsora americana]|nr:DNA polymerase alpha/epsilon subunit B-domain-containing protein [Melampsora americana]